jgi:hypothetical protein
VLYLTAAGDFRDFYILAGTSAATLVGLLFVGLSLHLRIVVTALLATEVGFSDQAHMTRTLRAETELTPGRLRTVLLQ